MSARHDLKDKIFGDLYVLEFSKQVNTHAQWKCLCMLCNELTYVTAPALILKNRKSCQSCGQKKSNGFAQDVFWKLESGISALEIAKSLGICHHTVYRIKKDLKSLKINRDSN